MPDVTPSQPANSGADPVAMISAIIDAPRVTPATAPALASTPPADATQPETDEDEPVGNNAQVEGDGQETEDEQVQTAEIPLDQLEAIELEVKYKGDGDKDIVEKLPIKALREGYMRQQDYSRKTAEVARQREEVGEKARQAIDSERNAYQQSLNQLQALVAEVVAPELKDVNWNHLAANDPYEYVRLDNRRKQITETLASIKSKGEELTQKQTAERSQALRKVASDARARLEADIPDFNDGLYKSIMESATTVGYKMDEVAQWVDPRAIKLAHKAFLYDQLKAAPAPTGKKVVVAPSATKPGTTSAVPQQVQRKTKALETLRKSGRVDDLAAVIASQMR